MDIVRQGTVGKDFLVHTTLDLTAWDALKLRFIKPDGTLAFEVTDGVNPEDVNDGGAPANGDFYWTDAVGSFPIDTPGDLGIWSIVPVLERGGQVLLGAPSMQFKVIEKYAVS